MFTKKDSTASENPGQASSLPTDSSSFMLLSAARKRSNSHPQAETALSENRAEDRYITLAKPVSSPRGFIPGLTFDAEKYDTRDAGVPIPPAGLMSPRLFAPRNKSRLVEMEEAMQSQETQSDVSSKPV